MKRMFIKENSEHASGFVGIVCGMVMRPGTAGIDIAWERDVAWSKLCVCLFVLGSHQHLLTVVDVTE